MELRILSSKVRGCTKCKISSMLPAGGCPVMGEGELDRKFMIVGEAPGENEALTGIPFVGAAGKMLDTLLGKVSLSRSMFYITNVVKCRPTDNKKSNRAPSTSEIDACKSYLWQEIKLLQPKYIFTLGKVPTYLLLSSQIKKSFKLTDIIGKKYNVDYTNSIIIPNLHPSYIMQYGKTWIDVASSIFGAVNE